MKKYVLLSFLLICLSSYADYNDRYLGISFEGSEPNNKKYYLEVVKPDEFKVKEFQTYQYIIWKILKDKGYERVNYDQADIIIKVDYYKYVFTPSVGNVTNGREIVDLELYAYPKTYNNETIPYWKISMQKGGQIKMHFLYFMDWLWFQKGFHFIEYREYFKKNIDIDWKITKFKDTRTKYKASKEDIEKFNNRIKEFQDRCDLELYNSMLEKVK